MVVSAVEDQLHLPRHPQHHDGHDSRDGAHDEREHVRALPVRPEAHGCDDDVYDDAKAVQAAVRHDDVAVLRVAEHEPQWMIGPTPIGIGDADDLALGDSDPQIGAARHDRRLNPRGHAVVLVGCAARLLVLVPVLLRERLVLPVHAHVDGGRVAVFSGMADVTRRVGGALVLRRAPVRWRRGGVHVHIGGLHGGIPVAVRGSW
mmetsp:Transcript_1451/g.4674  ORF Transcript_1451/g.4674 Transcript_1451/m.4674 type:complete len:204 (-) Transcript_1451:132-743(-)